MNINKYKQNSFTVNILSALFLFFVSFFFGSINAQVNYTTPGTYSWTVPPCVTEITVKVWGGGGGGGGTSSRQGGTGSEWEACTGGGGGGGGGYAQRTYTVTPGETYTIVVGAGGVQGIGTNGNAVAGTGGTGGTSTFSGPATTGPGTLTGTAGTGGTGASANNTSGFNHIGDNGVGGTGGMGSNGTINSQGGSGSGGSHSASCADLSGAGGAAGSSGGNGAAGQFIGPCPHTAAMAGGTGNNGGGNGGNGIKGSISASKDNQDGKPGVAYGGGGGGGNIHLNSWANTWVTTKGGKGADGAVIIEYSSSGTVPDTPTISTTPPTCSANGTATITNYNSSYTYTFTPAGPTIGGGGVINNLTPGTSYTLTANGGSCDSDASIAFSIDPQLPQPPAPTAADQTFCGSATIGSLVPSGNDYNWYSVQTGGTPLSSSTSLSDGTTYYVSITQNGCESPRTPVTVTLTDGPEITIISDTAINCNTSVVLGEPAPSTPNPPDFTMAPTCQKTAMSQNGPLTQGSGIYNNGVVTTGGTTNINNTNTLVDVTHTDPMGPNAWQTLWYSDYSNQFVEVCPNNSFNITINAKSLYSNSPYFCQIWVDWNNDGAFDASEVVHNSGPYTTNTFTVNGTITVPAGQNDGMFRMRIRFKDNAPFVPTDNADGCKFKNPVGIPPGYGGYTGNNYGNYYFSDEVEDYAVKVDCGNNSGNSGDITYQWTPPTGLDYDDIPNPTATPDETTTYTVTVTDSDNGCVVTAQVTVIVAGHITIQATPGDCENGKYDLTGTITTDQAPSTGTLIVEDCDGNAITIATAPFNGTSFPFTITDLDANGNNCNLHAYFSDANCPEDYSFTAPAPCNNCVPPVLTINDIVKCNDNNIDLNDAVDASSEPAVITFYSSETDAENATNPIGNNVTTSGTYWVRAEDTGGDTDCYNVYSVNVTINILTYTANITDENCGSADGQIVLTENGGVAPYTYTLNGGSPQSNGTFSSLASDSYNVTITDANGCQVTGVEIVNSIGGPTITQVTPVPASCPTVCDGSISVSATGGTTPYSYIWKDGGGNVIGGNANSVQDLCEGNYTVQVIDAIGCKANGTAIITAGNNPVISQVTTVDASCTNICDGEISVTVNGGTAPYTYAYTDNNGVAAGTNSANVNGICTGTYDISVTDVNGCPANGTANVGVLDPGTFSVSSIDPTCGNVDGKIIISGLVSNTGYDITYNQNGSPVTISGTSDNAGTFTIDHQEAGTYNNFSATENGGCTITSTSSVVLTDPTPPTVSAPSDIAICVGESVTLTANAPNGGTISWDNGVSNGVAFVPSTPGTYTYTVTSTIDNCVATDAVVVTVEGIPTPDFVGDKLYGCEPLTVNFISTGSSGTNCIWNFGDGTTVNSCGAVTHTYSNAGIYTVSLTVTSAAGCTGTITKHNYIEVTPKPTAAFTADPMVTDIFNTQVNFTNESSNAHDYIWDFGDGSALNYQTNPSYTYSDEEPGNYIVTLIATNGDGCSDTARAVIKIKDVLIFYVPNAFTPDHDHYNEVFKPVFASGYNPYTYTLLIFDRWGEIIFESHNTDIGWDGTYGGNIVKDGVYVWKIEFKETMSDKHHRYVGHVTLIR
ncbi:MAG: gliding motility-associated C-terminal domain-containing protein [Brumimicrobium sp.]|nr:gliding motility-associated C-terminal domain-containing protein [Brumimicrobium sp.]